MVTAADRSTLSSVCGYCGNSDLLTFTVIGSQLHSIMEVGQDHMHCDLDIMESCSTAFYVGEGCFAMHPEESLLHERIVNMQAPREYQQMQTCIPHSSV